MDHHQAPPGCFPQSTGLNSRQKKQWNWYSKQTYPNASMYIYFRLPFLWQTMVNVYDYINTSCGWNIKTARRIGTSNAHDSQKCHEASVHVLSVLIFVGIWALYVHSWIQKNPSWIWWSHECGGMEILMENHWSHRDTKTSIFSTFQAQSRQADSP